MSISIHAPRVGSDKRRLVLLMAQMTISIHAPRVGSDHPLHLLLRISLISIHAPRVGSDEDGRLCRMNTDLFQSTLPVWGATPAIRPYVSLMVFQSTLPVWGATPQARAIQCILPHFNPRSPCGERR